MQVTLLMYPSPRYEYSDLTPEELAAAEAYLKVTPISWETSNDDTLKISIVQVTEEQRADFEQAVFGLS